jgi:hypothetical protein
MLSKIFYTVSLLFIVLFSVHANTISATDSLTSSDTLEVLTTQELPNITIIPQKKNNNDILNELPGSGTYINELELKKTIYNKWK